MGMQGTINLEAHRVAKLTGTDIDQARAALRHVAGGSACDSYGKEGVAAAVRYLKTGKQDESAGLSPPEGDRRKRQRPTPAPAAAAPQPPVEIPRALEPDASRISDSVDEDQKCRHVAGGTAEGDRVTVRDSSNNHGGRSGTIVRKNIAWWEVRLDGDDVVTKLRRKDLQAAALPTPAPVLEPDGSRISDSVGEDQKCRHVAGGTAGESQHASEEAAVRRLDVYAGLSLSEPESGDIVFKHPYIQSLLDRARARIDEELAKQPGPPEAKWLICVRTYGRIGSSVWKFVGNALPDLANPKVTEVKEKLARAGIVMVSELKKALKESRLREILTAAEVPLKKVYLEALHAHMDAGSPDVGRKLKTNHRGVLDMTLAALTRALGPKAYEKCLIFASHEDPAFVSGGYEGVLEDTPWKDRIVCGIKGAHLQVRFIEEAAPLGTHIVILDDNIDEFVVERSSEKEAQLIKQQHGADNHLRRNLSPGPWKGPLDDATLKVVEETEVQSRIRHVLPDAPKERALIKGMRIELGQIDSNNFKEALHFV